MTEDNSESKTERVMKLLEDLVEEKIVSLVETGEKENKELAYQYRDMYYALLTAVQVSDLAISTAENFAMFMSLGRR